MRAGTILLIAGLLLMSAGCGSDRVELGSKGETSPAESGQHGANADQAPPYGPEARAKSEHEIKPITWEYNNGNTDPTMEGSGNLAPEGDLASAEKQRQGLMPQNDNANPKPTTPKNSGANGGVNKPANGR